MDRPLTDLEYDALKRLDRGGLLVSQVGARTETDVFSQRIGGRATYQRLEKAGLCFETEEDLLFPEQPELGTFTPTLELTDAGRTALAAYEAQVAATSSKRPRP